MQEMSSSEQLGTGPLKSTESYPRQADSGNTASALEPARLSSIHSPVDPSSSRPSGMQRSLSPTGEAGAVKYTRTGRVSKATKGRRIHHCDECGKIYTRAEHLRRHQQNHKPGAFPCNFTGCGRSFYREDLLDRHKARHVDTQDLDFQQEPVFPHTTAGADNDAKAVPQDIPHDVPTGGTLRRSTASSVPALKHALTPLVELPLQDCIALDASEIQSAYPSGAPLELAPSYSPSSCGSLFGGPYYGQTQLLRPFTDPTGAYLSEDTSSSYLKSPVLVSPLSCYGEYCSPDGQGLDICDADSPISDETYSSEPCTKITIETHLLTTSGDGAPWLVAVEKRDENELSELDVPLFLGSKDDSLFTTAQLYLNAYWHYIHPVFPVVHRSSFEATTASPLLKSVMIALGAHMTQDSTHVREATVLHERCLKVLDKRTASFSHTYRACDMQAIFLIELCSLFKSRRIPSQVSKSFEDIFRMLAEEPETFSNGGAMSPHDSRVSSLSGDVSCLHDTERECKRRILLSCYILDQLQSLLFGRQRTDCKADPLSIDPPWPKAHTLWCAASGQQVGLDGYQRSTDVTRFSQVGEALYTLMNTSTHQLDAFQSMIMLAGLRDTRIDFQCAAGHLTLPGTLYQTPRVTMAYHTAMLCKHTPVLELLAVAGESWVMAKKLASQHEYTRSQHVAKDWAIGSSGAATSVDQTSVLWAVQHALRILDIRSRYSRTGLIYQEWAIYLAAVVIWARAYILDFEVHRKPRLSMPSPAQPTISARELDQAVTSLLSNGASTLAWSEAKSVLLWTKAKIEALDVSRSCGLTVTAMDVLSKLCRRGNEQGWFG